MAHNPCVGETAYIYTLSDPRDNSIRYVGKSKSLRMRLSQHLCDTKRCNTKKTGWIKSLKKSGLRPIIQEIESYPHEETEAWQEAERFWIQTLRFYGFKLTNLETGGIGGKNLAAETKKKISESRQDFRHRPETKIQISISCKARMTPEEKERLRIKCSKNRHTDAVKKIISESKIGKSRPLHVRAALLAGSLKWKAEHGRHPQSKCVVCKRVIIFPTPEHKNIKWFIAGVGHIHNKCRKLYDVSTTTPKIQSGQQLHNPTGGSALGYSVPVVSGMAVGQA